MIEAKTCLDQIPAELGAADPKFSVGAAGETPLIIRPNVEKIVHLDVIGMIVEETSEEAISVAANRNESLWADQFMGCEVTETEHQSAAGRQSPGGIADELNDGLKRREMGERVAHADNQLRSDVKMVGKICQVIANGTNRPVARIRAQLGEEQFAEVEAQDPVAGVGQRQRLEA